MGAISDNRIKFNKPNLKAIERRVNQGEFTKETYLYDADSHLAVRVRPNRSYIESVFCMYTRIRVRGEHKSRMYKRQLMKVGEARNAQITISELRQKVDSLFLEIQEGRDPQVIAQQRASKQADEQKLIGAKRSLKDMIYGTPIDESDECMPDGFIAERSPGQRYLVDIKNKCEVLLIDLLGEPLHGISAEQVKTVYLQKVGRGKTQLDGAMRILRSVWNWAQAKYDESDLFVRNPVSRAMKQLGVNINRTNRRNVRLDESDFKPYLLAVLNLRQHDHTSAFRNGRDALLFMLFSGVRLSGTMAIRMSDVDLNRLVFSIIKKGGDRVELPLNVVTTEIVRNRQKYLPQQSVHLFPGIGGRGHYRDTKAVRSIVQNQTGIAVTNHDLRRTYKTIGTELEINQVLVDELCSHAREGVDAHYIHPSMTSLRKASQKIADYMIEKSGFDVIGRLVERW